MKPLCDIFQENARWVATKLEQDPRYFEKLSHGQRPQILYIGCSDSRVTAEELMGADPDLRPEAARLTSRLPGVWRLDPSA